MTCPNCGADASGFVCPNCGGPMPAPGPSTIAQPRVPSSATPSRIAVAHPNDAKNWAMGVHLSALLGMIFPFANVIGPLVVWMSKRDESALVDREGKEALNFQISMTIYMAIAGVLTIVLIGLVLLPVVAILDVIFTIVAAVKTSNGEQYRYPLTLRFIK